MKKWGRRILIGLLLATTLSMVAPAIAGHFVDNQKTTVHAATTTIPECATGISVQSGNECTLKAGEECPSGFEKYDNTTCKIKATEKPLSKSTVNTINLLVGLQKLMNRLIWPVLIMIGGLMDNSLLFGNGMEERLREIWIPIRNIVNILFVIVLMGIALYNVLGIGDENSNYSIKAILPKIIIGIIVVNFSFLGIKVFLDGINVLTTAIFALPNQVGQGIVLDPKNPNDQNEIDKTCRLQEGLNPTEKINKEENEKKKELDTLRKIAGSNEFKAFFEGKITNLTAHEIRQLAKTNLDEDQHNNFTAKYDKNMKGMLCIAYIATDGVTKMQLTPQGELFLKRWNVRSAPLAMAVGLGKIIFYDEIDTRSLASLDKVVINSALSFILYLLYLASFVALFVVLLGRLVVMWLAIVLSPVLLLAMAIPVVKEKLSGFGEITNTFVQNAIAPLGIALSLSVGWIMLKALQGLNSLNSGETISYSATQGIPVVGLTTLQDLLVGVGTIAVIWLGVFTAASKSIAAPVTDMMKSGLSRAGSWVGTLPFKHAPIFHIDLPNVKGDERYTGSQVWDAVRNLGTEKNKRKLTDLIEDRKGVVTKDFENVTTADHARDLLKKAGNQNMSAADFQTSAKILTDNRRLFGKIETKFPEIAKKLTTMAKADSKTRKKAKKRLLNVESIRTHRIASTTTTSTTSGLTKTAVTHNIQIQLLKKAGTTPDQITAAIKKLSPETTIAALKNQIDDDESYKKVLDAYDGDEEKLKAALPK